MYIEINEKLFSTEVAGTFLKKVQLMKEDVNYIRGERKFEMQILFQYLLLCRFYTGECDKHALLR